MSGARHTTEGAPEPAAWTLAVRWVAVSVVTGWPCCVPVLPRPTKWDEAAHALSGALIATTSASST